MISSTKNYKIIVNSKHFGNMKGIRPAEVAKKAAGKILGKSNNRITQFSMIETKNGKIRNYKAFKENLIRPYKKNGKLITCRIIVKKIGKHTGGGEADSLSKICKKEVFTEEDRKKIKAAMFIKNYVTNESKTYDPFNLTTMIKNLIANGKVSGLGGAEYLELSENDPIRLFFSKEETKIELDDNRNFVGSMTFNYKYPSCNIIYEFTGDEESFVLNIYNLSSCSSLLDFEGRDLRRMWEDYIEFLKKLYPSVDISIRYYKATPNSNSNSNRNKLEIIDESNFRNIFQNSNNLSNGNWNN